MSKPPTGLGRKKHRGPLCPLRLKVGNIDFSGVEVVLVPLPLPRFIMLVAHGTTLWHSHEPKQAIDSLQAEWLFQRGVVCSPASSHHVEFREGVVLLNATAFTSVKLAPGAMCVRSGIAEHARGVAR